MTDELHRTTDDGEVLSVHVQPGAGRTAVVGRHGTALKVKVAAPPEGGRANDAVLALLATSFGLPTSAVELVGGAASRSKQVLLRGVEASDVDATLRTLLATDRSPGDADHRRR